MPGGVVVRGLALLLLLIAAPHSVGRDAAAPARGGRGRSWKPPVCLHHGLPWVPTLRLGGGGGGGGGRARGVRSSASPIGKRAHSSRIEATCGGQLVVGRHYVYVRRSGKMETVCTFVAACQ